VPGWYTRVFWDEGQVGDAAWELVEGDCGRDSSFVMARPLLARPHANLMEAPSGDMRAAVSAVYDLAQHAHAAMLRGSPESLNNMSSLARSMIVRDAGERLDITAAASIQQL